MTRSDASTQGAHEGPTLSTQSGIVVSLNIWSETDVSGVVWSNGGHVSSSRTEVMQIFLQQEDGREIDLKINNTKVGARVGHYLSLVWARTTESSNAVGVALVNHTTGRYEVFDNRIGQLMGDAMADLNGCFFSVLAIIAAMVFGSFLGELKSVVITIAVCAIPLSLLLSAGQAQARRKAVRQTYHVRILAFVKGLLARELQQVR